MPIYCYQCNSCDERFEVRHSMSFEDQSCIHCDSKDIFKVPALSETVHSHSSLAPRAGKIVDNYIENTKKEVKKEKQKLRKQEL